MYNIRLVVPTYKIQLYAECECGIKDMVDFIYKLNISDVEIVIDDGNIILFYEKYFIDDPNELLDHIIDLYFKYLPEPEEEEEEEDILY